MDPAFGLHTPLRTDSRLLISHVRDAFGASTVGIIHYGSRVHGAAVLESSEFDFVVVVHDYGSAIQSLVKNTKQRFSSFTGTTLSKVLAPSVLAVAHREGQRTCIAKCVVYSHADFKRASSTSSRDHFLRGRLFQNVVIAWTRDDDACQHIEAALLDCRRNTMDWVQTRLPAIFDESTYFRTLLQVSYAAEIRPEQKTRIEEVFAAQQRIMLPVYRQLLETYAQTGRLRAVGDEFRLANPTSESMRAESVRYFRRSKLRATARWLKSAWLYRGWVDYLKKKMHRRILRPSTNAS